MPVFDSKNWNSAVFQKYLETVPRVKQNALLKAGILRTRSDLKSLLVDQVGGNYINVPIVGRIGVTFLTMTELLTSRQPASEHSCSQ